MNTERIERINRITQQCLYLLPFFVREVRTVFLLLEYVREAQYRCHHFCRYLPEMLFVLRRVGFSSLPVNRGYIIERRSLAHSIIHQ